MKICVLIKQVPDKNSALTIAGDHQSLEENNITVTIRRSRGKDIDAACGQLANKS